MLTAIIKFTTPEAAARECLENLGEGVHSEMLDYIHSIDSGVNPASEVTDENIFALNNVPTANGYCRMPVAEHLAMALQYMKDSGLESPNVEIVKIEWLGQDVQEVEVDDYLVILEDGSDLIVHDLDEYPEATLTGTKSLVHKIVDFQVGTKDILDEEGNVIGTYPEYLGRMAL
jgi:hypothetical protein